MESPPSVPYQVLIHDPKERHQPNISHGTEAGAPPETPPEAPPIRLTYWADLMRNRPQRDSMSAPFFIFISAGMSLAYSIGFSYIPANITARTHIRICWFIGTIIGSLIGLKLVERLTKRLIYFIAIGFVLVNGICFTFAPQNVELHILGRYCDGIGFGITLPAFVMAASEQSVKRFRSMTLGTEHFAISFGILIRAVHTPFKNSSNDSNIIHGIYVLVYVGISLLCNLICTMESPVFHLRKGNEAEAINVLHSLRIRLVEPNEVDHLLAEHKQLLEEDAARGKKTNLMLGLKICPKIVGLYILGTMSFSLPIVSGLLAASLIDLSNNGLKYISFFVILRFIGALIGLYTLDTLGRRTLTAFSLFAGGILLIAFGAMFADEMNILDSVKMHQANVVIIVFQFFAGIFATASTSYLGEAFPVSVKPYFVVFSLCLESLIQILFFQTFKIDAFAIVVGLIQALFAGHFFITTHETKGTTLRGALAELNKSGTVNLKIPI